MWIKDTCPSNRRLRVKDQAQGVRLLTSSPRDPAVSELLGWEHREAAQVSQSLLPGLSGGPLSFVPSQNQLAPSGINPSVQAGLTSSRCSDSRQGFVLKAHRTDRALYVLATVLRRGRAHSPSEANVTPRPLLEPLGRRGCTSCESGTAGEKPGGGRGQHMANQPARWGQSPS